MPARKKARSNSSDSEDESWSDEDLNEAGFGEETRHLLDDDDDSDRPEVEETLSKHGRLRLRADIAVGKEYSGRKVSRKEAFDEQSDEEYDLGENEHEASEDDEGDEYNEDDGAPEQDDDLEAVNREYEQLQQEEQEMLISLKGKSDGDVHKGQAVKRQKELWDKALDTRIALQKLVTGSNRLKKSENEDDDQVQEAYQKLNSSALQTLHSLLDLEDAWLEENPSVLEASAEKYSKGSSESLEAAWERLNFSYNRLIPFRNRSVDRWQRKTQISTGAAASRAKLKAFNQSVSQQVSNAMKDPSRLITRMITGHKMDSEPTADAANGELDVFDDSEFYQQLLREFLESSDPNALGTLNHDAVRKLRNKKRKLVDRRASKGRKLRYTVHEQLVNFMVPEPISLPPMAPKLFASLFGSKSSLQEAAA